MSTTIARLYNWVTDKAAQVKITASKQDAELDQIIVALNRKALCASSAPGSPIAGQTWFDTTNKVLKVYRNNEWVIQGIVHFGTSAPATMQAGDCWVDSSGSESILKFRNKANTAWLETQTSVGGAIGSYRGLLVSRSSAAAIRLLADSLVLGDANGLKYEITAVDETATITTSGASGLVSSIAEAANTIYYLWIARKSSDGTVNAFLSTTTSRSTIAGQLDSGYDQFALVSCVGNDNSSNFIPFHQTGNRYAFDAWATMASGNVGLSPWVAVDLTPSNMSTVAGFVPSALSNHCYGSFAAGAYTIVTNDNSVADGNTYAPNKYITGTGSINLLAAWELDVLTADTIYWGSDASAGILYLSGFEINKLT